ncbi:lanthionine synthetase C family protein [Streptomyces pathocidini]|uniref:lanthionine synthetase C family protein n=1 Tax=Streptomyces pathocidini TaxID=1650571 RepID=UPI003404054D
MADRLADPRYVTRHATEAPGMEGALLANGRAGTALLFAELAHTEPAYADAARASLVECARTLGSAPSRSGLFSGLAGLGLAGRAVAGATGREVPIRRQILGALTPAARSFSGLVRGRLTTDDAPLRMADYDLLYGLTGMGVYFLAEAPEGSDSLGEVVSALTRLQGTRKVNGRQVPAWCVTSAPAAEDAQGFLNLGMAHGISGPLAFLSVVLLSGQEYPGLREAVERLAAWLLGRRGTSPEGGTAWPRFLQVDEHGRTSPGTPFTQLSWCYGDVSVGNAVRLAGRALGREDWTSLATRALLTACGGPPPGEPLRDAALCHGWSGLLALVLRGAEDAPGDAGAELVAEHLAERVLEHYDPSTPFGFQADLGTLNPRQDDPGFLMGAAGIALALHAYGTGGTPRTGWDAALLLGPPV